MTNVTVARCKVYVTSDPTMVSTRNIPDDAAHVCAALDETARLLGLTMCWYYDGAFHFRLPAGWTISIAPESAGRLTIGTWQALRLRDRTWCRLGDTTRLRALVRAAQQTALHPA